MGGHSNFPYIPEFLVIDEGELAKVPKNLSLAEAGCFAVSPQTAWQGIETSLGASGTGYNGGGHGAVLQQAAAIVLTIRTGLIMLRAYLCINVRRDV